MRDARLLGAALCALLLSGPAQASPELARAKNCVSCHHAERKMLGPSFKAIAERYASDSGAAERLSAKTRAGGVGVWGRMPMPAQPAVSEADADAIVKWILSLH